MEAISVGTCPTCGGMAQFYTDEQGQPAIRHVDTSGASASDQQTSTRE